MTLLESPFVVVSDLFGPAARYGPPEELGERDGEDLESKL